MGEINILEIGNILKQKILILLGGILMITLGLTFELYNIQHINWAVGPAILLKTNTLYDNYLWIIIGLLFIILGYILIQNFINIQEKEEKSLEKKIQLEIKNLELDI